MRIPKKARRLLRFKHNETWYKIVQDNDKYVLYRCGETESDYEMLGTASVPTKLEERVYSGKVK